MKEVCLSFEEKIRIERTDVNSWEATLLGTGNTRHFPARTRDGIAVIVPSALFDLWTRQTRIFG